MLARKLYRVRWEVGDPATPALLDPMLDDKGVPSGPAREAVKAWCKEFITWGEASMGDMGVYASVFLDGYKAATDAQKPALSAS